MSNGRNGSHPIDTEVDGSGMLGWVIPAVQLAIRHVLTIAPATLIVVILVLTARFWLPWVLQVRGEFASYIVQYLLTALTMLIAAFGYILLVMREGAPHGIGGVAPIGSWLPRLLLMLLIWALASTILGWLLRGMLESSAGQYIFGNLIGWLARTFGLENAALILVWLCSPLFIVLGTMSTLCNVLCIRSQMGIGEILSTVFSRVFERIGRLILPGLLLMALFLLFLKIIMSMGRTPFVLIATYPYVIVSILMVITFTLSLAWWFVLERAWLPEAGVEDDLDAAPAEFTQSEPTIGPTRSTAAKPTPLNAGQIMEVTRHTLQVYLTAGQPDQAATAFAEWLRGGQRSVADLNSLLTMFDGQWPALAPVMGGLTAELARNNRSFEALELTRHGLANDPAFLSDQPDTVPSFAKRLVQTEQPDLAMRLLATYVRVHRSHSEFLGAGLLLARLLISHANQPQAAGKLLTHLKTLYPQEMQIDLLLRQLGSAS